MRPRTLLILLVVVLGLGAFIWFYERELPSTEEREELAKKILPVEKDDVQAVTLEFDGQVVSLERVEPPPPAPGEEKAAEEPAPGETEDAFGEGQDPEAEPSAQWRMTRPRQARADAFAVDGFLDSLTNLQKTRTLEGAVPAEVGLDKPQAVVRLRLKGGEERVLRIGSAVPTGGAVIAQEGDTTAVVSDSILPEIRREPGSWRDRRLFTADREAVQRVGLNAGGPAGGPSLALVRKGPGFQVEGPFKDAAARERVEELFSDLSGLSAEAFVDQPDRTPAEMGLQPPQAVVQVALQGKPPVRIELGSPVEESAPEEIGEEMGPSPVLRWARVDGQLVQARTGLVEMVSRPAVDWRSGLLSAFEVHQIEKVEVQEGPAQTSLTRAGTDWKRGEETVSYVPVSDLLFAVTGAEAERLLAPAEIRLGPPALTFTLAGKEAAAETLTLFPGTPQGVPARVSGRDAVLLLPAGKLQEIRERLKAVREAKPLTGEEAEE